MWFDGVRQPNTIYVASVSRGKDSTAMLRAIQLLGFPLDMVYSVDIWFDDETPAELPPMVEFKDKWDERCKELFGIEVTRLCAMTTPDKKVQHPFARCPVVRGESETPTQICSINGCGQISTENITEDFRVQIMDGANCSNQVKIKEAKTSKLTYCDIFYRQIQKKKSRETREKYVERMEQKRKQLALRVSSPIRELVQERTQILRYGFPNPTGVPWCRGELKISFNQKDIFPLCPLIRRAKK